MNQLFRHCPLRAKDSVNIIFELRTSKALRIKAHQQHMGLRQIPSSDIPDGILSLTKNEELSSKTEKIQGRLRRIKFQTIKV
jgi:hypothetical protein